MGRQGYSREHPCGKDRDGGGGWWGAGCTATTSLKGQKGLSSVHQLCVGVAPDGGEWTTGLGVSLALSQPPFSKGMAGHDPTWPAGLLARRGLGRAWKTKKHV